MNSVLLTIARYFAVSLLIVLIPGIANTQTQPSDPGTPSPQGAILKSVSGWIGLTASGGSGNSQESYIIISPEATFGFDQQYDLPFLPGQGPVFYTISDGYRLSTNSIPALSDESEFELVFIPESQGQYRILASGLEMIERQVYMYDNLSKSDINLSVNPEYMFQADPGDDSTRFMLHFITAGITPETVMNPLRCWYANSYLHTGPLNDEGFLAIFDMKGQQVFSVDLEAGSDNSFLVQLTKGIYVVRLYSRNRVSVVKIPVG